MLIERSRILALEIQKTYIEQKIIELASFMVHKHYCENDVETLIAQMTPDIIWIGAGEKEYAVGKETVAGIFRQFIGKVPKCNISEEYYDVLQIAPDSYLCSGKMWIATDSSTQIYLRVHQRITLIFQHIEGVLRCCHIHISNPYDDMGNEVGFPIKIAQQSYQYLQEQIETQKKQIASQTAILERMSFEDALTGLYNRNKFTQILEDERDHPKKQLGVACFDLNGLKKLNDQRGHSAGDVLICRAAEYLGQVFRGKVYRTGGDEFVVIDDMLGENEFHTAVHTAKKRMEENQISVSVGAVWRCVDCNLREQVDEADQIMYQEKRRYYSMKENDRRNRR